MGLVGLAESAVKLVMSILGLVLASDLTLNFAELDTLFSKTIRGDDAVPGLGTWAAGGNSGARAVRAVGAVHGVSVVMRRDLNRSWSSDG